MNHILHPNDNGQRKTSVVYVSFLNELFIIYQWLMIEFSYPVSIIDGPKPKRLTSSVYNMVSESRCDKESKVNVYSESGIQNSHIHKTKDINRRQASK